jgi:hypothetical protein
MKNSKWVMLLVALMLMAGTAGALTWLRVNQKLGAPGIKGTPVSGSVKVDIYLPERVLDFTSTNVPELESVSNTLPQDTSYAERFYIAPDGFRVQNTIILMGSDRTSIHRPEYCFPGQGYSIDEKKIADISINDHPPYQLEVARWNVSISVEEPDGQKIKRTGIYVYWYVANGEETPDHDKMLEWLTLDLFRTGKLQRWAYVSYFAQCPVGREDEAFERIKKLIIAQAPQFQLPLRPK